MNEKIGRYWVKKPPVIHKTFSPKNGIPQHLYLSAEADER